MKKLASPITMVFMLFEIIASVSVAHYLVPLLVLTYKNILLQDNSESLYLVSILWIALTIILTILVVSILVRLNQKMAKFNFHFINGLLGAVIGLLIGATLFFFAPHLFNSIQWSLTFFVPMIIGLNIGLRKNLNL